VVGQWEQGYLKGSPAVTEQAFGQGKAIRYGSLFDLDASRYLLRRYAAEVGLKPMVQNLPDQIEVTRRTKGRTDFYFLLNHDDTAAEANIGDSYFDVLAGAVAPARLVFAPFDYYVLRRDRLHD